MPEIGLSGLMLDYPHSGSAVYARNLLRFLPMVAADLEFRLFVRQSPELPPVAVQRLSTPFGPLNHGSGVGARLDKLAWEVISLPLAAALRKEALLHSLYFAAPVTASVPVIVTIHDLIPLVVPGYHRTRQSALYSRFMAWTARHAAAIITVSEHSRRDIAQELGVPASRLHVTYEAVDERYRPDTDDAGATTVRTRYRLPERFFLYIGGAERRKNLETLIRAWAVVAGPMRDRDIRLVIVADFPRPDPLYPDVAGLARTLGLHRDVCFVPRIDEQDKPDLYRAALAFCFPSTYEGFGFTPLEAMASGVPVLASHATSIPEVVGDGGWLLDPQQVAAWADAMLCLADSAASCRELRERGLRRANAFSWKRTAEETVAVYREVLGG